MRAGPQLRVDAFSISNYGSAGSVMPVCMQPVATLTLQTFAKVFLGRRLHSHDEQSLSPNYLTIYLALFRLMHK